MARPAQGDRIKLDRLRIAKPKAEALPRRTILDAKPMAELLAINWPTLRDWVDAVPALEAKGAVKRGGNGVPWAFKPVRTIDLLAQHFGARADKQAKRTQAHSQSLGVAVAEEESAASFAEVKGMVDMTITVVSAREKQGQYVPAADMAEFIEGFYQRITAAILGVRTKVDPNGNLPPHVRAETDDYLRAVASHVHAEAAAYIEERQRARIRQEGVG